MSASTPSAPAARPSRPAMPSGVWVLGFTSLLMDISSEMIHSLLPLFLVGPLALSVLTVGVIEGIAESTALITKVFSGMLSDWLGRRKGLAVLGYALGAASKPVFALAHGASAAGIVIAARFADRVGKGLRGAPRDALLADITPPAIRGAAFGLRQSLDTVGAFTGPLLATGLMLLWAGDFRAVFWVAVIPGALSVAVLALGLREPPRPSDAPPPVNPIRREALARLPRAFWQVVAIGALATLARFSEAFLVLRTSELGVAAAWVPLVMVAMSGVYAASAYPFGRLADRISHRRLLVVGLALLVAADAALALAHLAPGQTGRWAVLGLGVALWGVHMGATQGLLAAMVADSAPAELRGTAFGLFNLASGLAMLAASVIAGGLWQAAGPAATFGAGAAFAGLTLAALAGTRGHTR